MSESGSEPRSISVTANGEAFSTSTGTTIAAFIESRGLNPVTCVVELNGEALAHSEFASRLLQSGDRLEIVRAVAGGAGGVVPVEVRA